MGSEKLDIRESLVGQFYGPERITDAVEIEIRTPLGSPVYELTTEPGRKYLIPQAALGVITPEIKDANHIRDWKVRQIVPRLVDIVAEFDLPKSQLIYLASMFGSEFDNHFGRATSYLWTRDDRNYVPGFDSVGEISLLMAERVNAQIPEREEAAVVPESIPEAGDVSE